MDNDSSRYSGPATILWYYAKEFLVECPKCKNLAVVTKNQSSNYTLTCQNCNHLEKSDELLRYNATVKRFCDNCEQLIDITILNNKEKVEELTISCTHCGIARTYKPKNDAYRLTYKNTGICDPIFNLPLWFRTDIKEETFWAYNREHLNEIRNYVSAKLRERQTTTHTTMVEKLPNFIKVAKNRNRILKAIDKLARK